MPNKIEIIFKGERKELYVNPQQFPFVVGDYAIVEADKGEDLGIVNQLGSVLTMKKVEGPVRQILRKPSVKDLDKYRENRKKEMDAFKVCRDKIDAHDLPMKLVDVEYQFDGNKITFYFTAEKRVDFRGLVKDLANEYKVRIELRQIGVRDEAKRMGGYGLCGRKICCTTFLREFEPISTQCAKEQNLPLNPQKLSGLCGRLLCCLMYEQDFYREQTLKFPPVQTRFNTPRGIGTMVKIDVFKEEAVLVYENDDSEAVPLDELSQFENLGKPSKKNER